jgi:hypothetical protein
MRSDDEVADSRRPAGHDVAEVEPLVGVVAG